MNRMNTCRAALGFAAALCLPAIAHADVVVLDEGFGNIAALAGWTQLNSSTPPGNGWFQGNPDIFEAQAGPADSYIAVNFTAAGPSFDPDGNPLPSRVDTRLLTPIVSLSGQSTVTYFTRRGDPAFADVLAFSFLPGDGSAPLDLLPLASMDGGGGWGTGWQQFTFNLFVDGSGRFAFRYQGDADTLNYIGLDSFRVVTQIPAVPEPASALALAVGMGMLAALRRRLAD